MAVKTITIDLEAYELLRRRKQTGQSFSQVIKAQFGGRDPRTAARLLAGIGAAALGAGVLDEVDGLISERWKSVPDIPVLRDRPSRALASAGHALAKGRSKKAASAAEPRRNRRRRA